MRVKRKSEAQLLSELRASTDYRRGLKETAERLGFTPQFLSDVLYGRRSITERLAESMGYRRVVEYEEVEL